MHASRATALRCPVVLVASALALVAGVARGATTTVQVGPNGMLVFSPVRVTIAVGDTVKWMWQSGPQSTTRDQSPDTWDSGVTGAPHSFSHTFMRTGTFDYFCSVHANLGMTGTVVVREPSGATTTTTLAGSTTTTSVGQVPATCADVDACRAVLAAALPTAAMATTGGERKVVRLLAHLSRRADALLARATTAQGRHKQHLLKRVTHTLEHLQATADKAAAHGTLVVSGAPIDAAVQSLLALVPTS